MSSEESSQEEGSGIGELRIQDVRSVPSASSDGEFQIKEEPEDQGYEIAILGNVSISDQINQQLNNEVWTSVAASLRESEKEKNERLLLPLTKTMKETRKGGATPDMRSIIDGLLLKNEYLLSQNDASCFKPYSRAYKHRSWNGEGPRDQRSERGTSYYSVPSPSKHASVQGSSRQAGNSSHTSATMPEAAAPGHSEVNGSASSAGADVPPVQPGLILKPRCPTEKCKIPQQDRSHFSLALMESKVLDRPGSEMFRIHKHELVCAISCNALMINPAKTVVAQFDMKYYWCNFCQFNTSDKNLLLSHVVEHRFTCKYCRYQSFSRADVIHHTSETHCKFAKTASVLNFCTLLPDYLQVTSQTSDGTCQQEQEDAKQEHGESGESRGVKRETSESSDEATPGKLPRRNADKSVTLNDQELEEDFEPFEMMDVSASSEGNSPVPKKLSTHPHFASAHPTVVSMLSDVPGSSEESSPPPQNVLDASPPPSLLVRAKPSGGLLVAGGMDSHLFSSKAKKVASQSSAKSHEKGTQLGCGLDDQETAAGRPQSSGQSVRRSSSSGQGSSSSDLIWQCGYCDYNSALQSEIKKHSAQAHAGMPGRVVASIEANGKAAGTSAHFTRKRKSTRDDGDEESMEFSEGSNDDSLVRAEGQELDADFTLSSKASKGNRKSTSTQFQCFHCTYTAKRLGAMKNHIFNVHKGLGLIGLDLSSQTRERHVRFCLRDGCRFFTENAAKFKRHVSVCTPWNAKNATDVKVEDYLLSCLDKTINFSASNPAGETQGDAAE